jgi:hypothetical protein
MLLGSDYQERATFLHVLSSAESADPVAEPFTKPRAESNFMSQSAGPPDTWPATTPPAHPDPGFDSYIEDHAYEADDGLAEYSQDQYATASEDGDQTAPKADPIGTA